MQTKGKSGELLLLPGSEKLRKIVINFIHRTDGKSLPSSFDIEATIGDLPDPFVYNGFMQNSSGMASMIHNIERGKLIIDNPSRLECYIKLINSTDEIFDFKVDYGQS